MFTGLIKELAKVASYDNNILSLNAKYIPKIGDSVAVNGACLSVIRLFDGGFSVELSAESTKVLAMKNYKNQVHIEPAMKLNDRLEGHILQGHIDCIGEIIRVSRKTKLLDFYIKVPKEYMKFIAPKGSIAIDGVSLTVNECFEDSFRLSIIPLTYKNTKFENYKPKDLVNIETDLFARYLYNIFKKEERSSSWEEVDKNMAALF